MKRFCMAVAVISLLVLPWVAIAEPTILTTEIYQQTGTTPVYRATARNFAKQVKPELFNQTGIATRDEWQVVFADEATLDLAPEALFYNENSGVFDTNLETEGPDDEAPLPALSNAVGSLAGWAMNGWPGTNTVYRLERKTLTNVTLEGAKQTLETLLTGLGLTGYTCDYALDMSLARIQALGDAMNALIASGEFCTNIPAYDYHQATAAEEGYYLRYHKFGEYVGDGNLFSVDAYVTAKGVVMAAIRDAYIPGEIYETPAALVTPESVIAKLPKDAAESRYPSQVVGITAVQLSYAPMRAPKKAEGMVLSPIWLIVYQDEDSVKQGYDCWAEYNAITGDLLGAMFK